MKPPTPHGDTFQLSAELLSALLEISDSLIVVLDTEGRIEVFNRACETATGFRSNQVRGRLIWDVLIPEEQVESVKGVFDQARVGDKPSYHENHWLTKDGGRKLISWANTVVLDETGKVLHIVSTGTDVTAFEKMKADRLEQEHFYRALVETMTDGLAVDDLEGNLTYVNRTICKMLGYTQDELIGHPLTDFVDEESGRVLTARIANRSTETSTEPYDLTIRRRDGSTREVLVSPQITVAADGQKVGTFAVLTDITALKRMEQEQTLLGTAIEQAAEAVVITDADGTIEYINPAFERITGYTSEEAVGANPRILKSGKHDQAFYRDLWETISGGRVWSGQFENLRKDGTLFIEEATISPVRGEKGEIVAYVAVKRDVTTERELALQLNRSQKLEALGKLAGGIAHDFNNLLTAITGSAELLRLRLGGASGAEGELETIREAAARAAELTRQLLSVARRQVLEMAVFDLTRAIREEYEVLHRVLPETIDVVFTPGVERLPIRGDRDQIGQILMNLCVNARDAMQDGGAIHLSTAAITADALLLAAHPDLKEGRYARLRVEDTGAGMDAAVVDRIFEPFFTTKTQSGGSGLGLATVYGSVQQHGGMVEVESRPGAGTRFDVFFPLTSKPLDETDSGAAHTAIGGCETILVVEDEVRVRQIQVGMLEALGYTVLEAENGRAALDVLIREGDAVDMVLSDVIMPEMEGQELFDRARELRPDLAFVFSSGYTGGTFLDRFQQGETVHFIAKPYSMAQLATIIRKALAG